MQWIRCTARPKKPDGKGAQLPPSSWRRAIKPFECRIIRPSNVSVPEGNDAASQALFRRSEPRPSDQDQARRLVPACIKQSGFLQQIQLGQTKRHTAQHIAPGQAVSSKPRLPDVDRKATDTNGNTS